MLFWENIYSLLAAQISVCIVDQRRGFHSHQILLLIANQVTNHCWIQNKQNLLWRHMALDHQVNETTICQKENVTGSVKVYHDFHILQGVYGVWDSFMNHHFYLLVV